MQRRTETPACPFHLGAELRFIAQCTLRPPASQRARWLAGVIALGNEVTDWNEALRLIRRHQVAVLVDDALQTIPAATAGTHAGDFLAALAAIADRRRMHALRQIAQSSRIAASFASNAIRVIQLKGAPLSQRLYGDPTLRSCSDIDLLVEWNSLRPAIRILQSLQFELTQEIPASSSISGLITRHAYHDCTLLHPTLKLYLELHWRPGVWGSSMTTELFRHSRSDAQFGPAAPPEKLEMVDLLVHGTTHYWLRLKWLSDIQQAALTRPASFWNDVERLAGEMGAMPAMRIAALLACWIFQDRAAALSRIAADASLRDYQAARYALKRMLAARMHPRDARSLAAKTCYRVATCTAYQLTSTALRCIHFRRAVTASISSAVS